MTQPRDPQGRYTYKITLGSILTAGIIGIAAAAGVGAEGAGAGAGASTVSSVNTPSLSGPVRVTRGKQKSGGLPRRLVSSGLRPALQAEGDSESCAADARGDVGEFLETHPCESVYRALFEVRRGQVAALVAVAWIEMVEEPDATELKALVDRPGTGNVNQLPPSRGQRVVDVGEPAYASRQRGRLVTTVEVQPVVISAPPRALDEIAQQAARSASQAE